MRRKRLAGKAGRFTKRLISIIGAARSPVVVGAEINIFVGVARKFGIRVDARDRRVERIIGNLYAVRLIVGTRAVFLRPVKRDARRREQDIHFRIRHFLRKRIDRFRVTVQALFGNRIHFHCRVFCDDNIVFDGIFPDFGRGGCRLGCFGRVGHGFRHRRCVGFGHRCLCNGCFDRLLIGRSENNRRN